MPNHNSLSTSRGQRGVALIFALFIILFVLGGVALMSVSAWTESQFAEREKNLTKGLYGGEAGIAFAENLVWNDYVNAVNGNRGLIDAYKAWLDNVAPVGTTDVTGLLPVPQLDGMTRITNLQIMRTDNPENTFLTLQSTGQDRWNNPQVVTEHLLIQGEQDSDVNFGILARNLECVFCHAEIDNVLRVYNTNPARYGTFDRIRVGAIGDMFNRDPDANNGLDFFTHIAGTLYTRGALSNKADGSPMTQGEINASSLDGYQFDGTSQYVLEDGTGAPTQVNLQQATGNPLNPNENLYMEYPDDPAEQTDGILPDMLRMPFEDVDNNLVVSAADIAARLAAVQADVGVRGPGTISGGILFDVPLGNTYNSGMLPGAGNIASIDTAGGGLHQGNVIMVGTQGNPLILNNTVVVEGDVMLSGYVQGEGQLYASGNVYIVGDLRYNNTGPTWGVTADGQRNLFMIRAGGNIMVNDFITPQRTYTYDPADPTDIDKLPVADAQAVIDDVAAVDTGDHRVPPGSANVTGTGNGSWWSYGMEQIVFYNRNEWTFTQVGLQKNNAEAGRAAPPSTVANSSYDPTYRPVYLTMHAADPVYVYGVQSGSGGTQIGTYWNTAQDYWRGDPRPIDYLINEDVASGGLLNAQTLDGAGQLAVGGWNGDDAPGDAVTDTEDTNGNGTLEPPEDGNLNGVLDTQDLNGNGIMDEGPIVMLTAADVATQNGAVIQLMPNQVWISDQNLKSLWVNDNTARAVGDPILIEAGLNAGNTILATSRNGSRYNRNARGQLTINGLIEAKNIGVLATADTALGVNVGFRMHYDPRLVAFNTGVVNNPVAPRRLALEYN